MLNTGVALLCAATTFGASLLRIAGPTSLPNGIQNAPYGPVTFTASGGTGAYTWSATGLPPGLSIDSSTGVLSGTPIDVGFFNLEVTVRDSGGTCVTAISPGGQVFSAQGGTGTASVTTTNCLWSVSQPPPWITLTSATSGVGADTLTYNVTPNSGAARSASIAIGSTTFTIQQQTENIDGLSYTGSLPHLAAGGSWTTTFTLVNKGTATAIARISQFAPDGSPLMLPVNLPQQPSITGALLESSMDQNIEPNASFVMDTAEASSISEFKGSAQLSTTGDVGGFAILHLHSGAQEVAVPLETRNAAAYLLAFDNTGGVELGVALQNVSGTAATIPVVIRDDTGGAISSPGTNLSLAANGNTSFVLSQQYPFTANKRGTIKFDTPADGRIGVLGIRTTPVKNTLTLTAIPAMANIGTSGGSIAHIATGHGWQTTFVLVNAGTSPAQAALKFFATDTGAPLSIPLSFPQAGSGSSTTASSVTQTLAAGATLLIQSAAPASDPSPTIGSAQLTTTGNIGGFVIFRYNTNGQEAVVPLENRTSNSYLIAFDNTSGTATGIAVNNVSAQQVSVPVIVRGDAGNQIDGDTLTLNANAHTSFTLGADKFLTTAGKRGSIEFVSGQIGALGIRIPPTLTFTTLPVLAK